MPVKLQIALPDAFNVVEVTVLNKCNKSKETLPDPKM